MSAQALLMNLQRRGFRLDVDGSKLLVTPASKLTEDMRAEIRQARPELVSLLTDAVQSDLAPQANQACTNCRQRSRAATCGEPVAAGLQDSHGIAWPEPGHGATCPAWKLNPAPAVLAVWTAAARGGWTAETVRQWLADADTEPRAVLDILTTGGPTP